jgi:antirestriction protein ArdC
MLSPPKVRQGRPPDSHRAHDRRAGAPHGSLAQALAAAEEGYRSPFWGTYLQIGDLGGGQVRKGEHSTLVVFWKQAQIEQRDPQTGEITLRQLPVLRYYRVFNAVQADDLPERFHPEPGEHSEIAEPQAVLDGFLARGPKLVQVAGDRAARPWVGG